MSTVAYGALTGRRKLSPPGETKEHQPPGVGTWADSFTALVPGEVLVLHAYVVNYYTDGKGITNPTALTGWLCGLLVLCVLFYLAGLYAQGRKMFGGWDFARLLIVLVAFGCWMVTQKPSALDAVYVPPDGLRNIGVPFVAILLSLGASVIGGNLADGASSTTRFEARSSRNGFEARSS